MDESVSKPADTEIQDAIRRWMQHLDSTLTAAMPEAEITTRMSPLARDSAWIPYGGTGRHSRLFLIDDYVQVRFDFDAGERLVSYSVYERKNAWLKSPDGTLLSGSDAPDAELRFPSQP